MTPDQTKDKKANSFGAIADWKPVYNADPRKGFQTIGAGMEWKKGIVQWFDFRRYLAVSAGLCLFTVQLFLAIQ